LRPEASSGVLTTTLKVRLRSLKIGVCCLPTVPGFETFIAKEFGPAGDELDQPLRQQ